MVFGTPNGLSYVRSVTSAGLWRANDWAPLFQAQRNLFNEETRIADKMSKHGLAQRDRIIGLLEQASQLWEAATWFQSKAGIALCSTKCLLTCIRRERLMQQATRVGRFTLCVSLTHRPTFLAAVEMGEARRLAYEYNRLIQECQRLITESQSMALAQREGAQAARRRLRQEYAARYVRLADLHLENSAGETAQLSFA